MIENATISISYEGTTVGLNEYKSLSWRKLKVKLDLVKTNFWYFLQDYKNVRLEKFKVIVSHNSNYDVDNLTGMGKPFVDQMVKIGIVKDDDKKHYLSSLIEYDDSLEENVILFQVITDDHPLFNPNKIKTYKEWELNNTHLCITGYLGLYPCEIDEELFMYVGDAVAPSYMGRNLIQSGEATDRIDDNVFTYETVIEIKGRFFFLGILPAFEQ